MQKKSTLLSFLLIIILTSCFLESVKAQSYVWARNQVGFNDTYGMASATDKFGNVFVTGNFTGATITFGSITLNNVSNSFPDFYIAKYDPDGKVLWARSAGATDRETGTGLAADDSGNVFVTGWYASPKLIFGKDTLINTAQYYDDVFLAKYDMNGNLLWAKSTGGGNDDRALAAATDPKGNVYITGTYKSLSMTFGSFTVNNVNGGNEDVFLAKYDASGNVIRADSYGGFFPDWGVALAVDKDYNLYMTGLYYSTSITFGTTTLSNNGQTDLYTVKFDSAGTTLWAKSAGGTGIESAAGISVDKTGNVYVSGDFMSPSISFGSTVLTDSTVNKAEVFIAKYDKNGNILWANSAKGSLDDYGNAVVADDLGFVYLTGSFNSPNINFGTTTLINKGYSDIFIAKYDPSGNLISLKSAGGSQIDFAQCAVLDANNNLFISGTFLSPTLTLGNDTLKNIGHYEMFVTKLSAFPAGINPPDLEKEITIFPNPSNGNFTITFPGTIEKGAIEIYSVIGQKVFSEPVHLLSKENINMNNLSHGIYFIKVSDGTKEFLRKISIE